MVENPFKKQILVFSLIVSLLFCSGCINISDNENNNPPKRDTLIIGAMSADSIYPLAMSDTNYWTIFPNVFNGLVEFDENFRIVPGLALSWNNPDTLSWRFSLREGVKFHNGDDFTAEDVRFSLDNMSNRFDAIIEEIIVLDTYTIQFKTFEPYPSLLERLAYTTIYCKNSSEQSEIQELIGTGPYRIADYEIGNYTTLKWFEDYWGKESEVKTVVFRAIENDEQRVNALLSGIIDIAEYNIDDRIDQLQQETNITVATYPPLSTYIIGFDTRKNGSYGYPDGMNPTADPRVRKAIYQAIDIAPLIAGPFKGYAQPASQFITQYIFGYDPSIERLPYNITTSKQLLAEAGYEDGFDIVMDCITEGYDYNLENCEMIAEQLSQVGIHVTLNELSYAEFDTEVIWRRNTSMYLVGWGTISMDGGWAYDYFIRSVGENMGQLNTGYYSNAEIDRLGIAASREMNPQERLWLLQEGFRIALVDDVVVVPLFAQELFILTAADIDLIPRADQRIVVKDIGFT